MEPAVFPGPDTGARAARPSPDWHARGAAPRPATRAAGLLPGIAAAALLGLGGPGAAQVPAAPPSPAAIEERAWVQIEARPTLAEASERANAYAAAFPDVSGYRLASGWYGIVLGPYAPDAARMRLDDLLAAGLVPRDSFIADGGDFREPFLTTPRGAEAAPVAVPPGVPTPPEPAAEPTPPEPAQPAPQAAADPGLPDETPAEARQSEARLTQAERERIQAALQWFGHYDAAIDGAFGSGTRASMAAWQQAVGAEPTGILTSRQRQDLLTGFEAQQSALGLQRVSETDAGIEITLPLALVRFDRHDPPFVHFAEKNGSGVQVMLISERGDRGTLWGLYEILQTLEVVPPEGMREKRDTSFTIEGRSDRIASYTHAELKDGLVKGFMLVWHPGDDERMARVLTAMQASFRAVGSRALDPGLVPLTDAERRGMLSGLEMRKPRASRSGIFVDAGGTVLTALAAVEGCARVTVERTTEARVTLTDPALGVALLAPERPLAPRSVAAFRPDEARAGAPVAVAGYPYEDTLPAPALTFGTLEAATGLAGEPDLRRLGVRAQPGDAGGPVLDSAGAVLGMLLPAPGGARLVPEGTAFALSSGALVRRLAEAGITPVAAPEQGPLGPEDLAKVGDRITALVSCWD